MQQTDFKYMDELVDRIANSNYDRDFVDALDQAVHEYKEQEIKPLIGNCNEEMINQLLHHVPAEEGGIIAISGFYFQMLVFIQYMIQMMEGKWEFLALEFHDDIVAGNEKTIKFVQVKTSKQATLAITDSSVHVYNRSKGKSEKTLGKLRNNSWVDKIIDNAHLVKDLNLNLEFDIVADYSIYSTSKVDIAIYNSVSRNKAIKDDDYVYKEIAKTSFNSEGMELNYETRYGKQLKFLLEKLCFVQQPKLENFKKVIRSSLSDTLGEGIIVSNEDINWLIGELMFKCSHRKSGTVLFLKRDQLEHYRQALRKRAVDIARATVKKTDAVELVDRAMSKIIKSFRECDNRNQLEREMGNYKTHLLNKINENNTIQTILQRFKDGKISVFPDNQIDYTDDLITFLESSILLYLIYEGFEFSDKFRTLLIKDAQNTEEHIRIGFLSLSDDMEIGEGSDLLKAIFLSSSEEEQLEMLWKSTSLYTILHGKQIESTSKSSVIELDTKEYTPKVEQFDSEFKSSEVQPVLRILPYKPLIKIYSHLVKQTDFIAFKDQVVKEWKELKGSLVI